MSDSIKLVAFDVETTGKNPLVDQIIEISICEVSSDELKKVDGDIPTYLQRFRPDVPVSPGAQAVHGISDQDLADEPPFSACADEVERLLLQADVLIGYNVGFDIRFVEAEFQRLGRKLDLYSRRVVDPLRIWQTMEPRRLENAVERFVGGSLEGAHSAEADTRAVLQVLSGMTDAFGLASDWDELALMTNPDRASWVGTSNHFRWEAGQVVVGFGKYAGRGLHALAKEDPDYIRWIQGADFPRHVQSLCKGALSDISIEEFHLKVHQHFPQPELETDGVE